MIRPTQEYRHPWFQICRRRIFDNQINSMAEVSVARPFRISDVKEVIEDMKGGSCFFIYHPDKKIFTGFKDTKWLTGRKLRWFEGEKVSI